MIKWVSILQDGSDDAISSKRLITLLAFIMCGVAFMVDTFTVYKVNAALFDSMMYIVIAGLGFTASEKFTKFTKTETNTNVMYQPQPMYTVYPRRGTPLPYQQEPLI